MAERIVLNGTSYHGKGAIAEIPALIRQQGCGKVFVCSDPDLVKFHVTDKVTDKLDAAGITYEIFDGVKPNPTIENVQDGVAAFEKSGAEGIIAIGGGSAIDTAKAIGVIASNPAFADVRSLEGVAPTTNHAVFTIAVPTTAGTAAEVTINYVVTDVEKRRKFVCVDTNDIPAIAVVDPDMMASMPASLAAATGMDALTHAIEGYTTKAAWAMTDMFHLQAIRLIAANLRAAVAGREMTVMRYTARKILTLLVTMLVVSLLTFAAFDMISGDPAATLLGTQATPEKVEALRAEMGLNRPMLVRYGEWLAGFFTGNLGVSFQYRQPVQALLGPKMLVTLCLSLVSFVLIVVVSLPLGLLSANGKLDGLHTFLNQFCMAVPPFFTGILISWCFGICLRAFVPGDFPGLDRNLGRSLVYLFFAAVSIAIPRVAMTVRMLRSTVISEMNKPYVRTAIARGNDRRQVLWGHVLKNSLVPTVTFLGQTMAEIVAGSIVVEQVFSVPGLGRMLVASISSQDYPVVEAIVVILAFWVVLSGTLADLVNRCIDPRMGGIGK